MYLEGPGRVRREVKIMSTEVAPASSNPRHKTMSGSTLITLVDAEGNIARQVDLDGYRFRFDDSEQIWSLAVR